MQVVEEATCILGKHLFHVFGHWIEELLKVVVLEAFGFDGYYVFASGFFPQFCFESFRTLGDIALAFVKPLLE